MKQCPTCHINSMEFLTILIRKFLIEILSVFSEMRFLSLIALLCFAALPLLDAYQVRNCFSSCDCTDHKVFCNRRNLNFLPKMIANERFSNLDFPGNNITAIDANHFKDCLDVIQINLDNNKISSISENAFRGPLNLEKLFLRNNRIEIFPDEIFSDHVDSLQVLALSNNQLKSLPVSLERMTNLKEIYLKGNPLHCGCETRFFSVNLRNIKIHEASVKCETPLYFQNKNLKDLTVCKKNLKDSNSLPVLLNKPEDVRVAEGEDARFDCQVSDINNTEIQWQLPFDAADLLNFYARSQTLIIQGVRKDFSGTITCIATNNHGSTRSSAQITVVEEESPSFNIKPENVTFEKGSKVVFTCNALGFPAPSITWLWVTSNRHELETGGKYCIRKNMLIVENVTEHDTIGHYECYAANIAGSAKASASIIIKKDSLSPCELGKMSLNETLSNVRKAINSVIRETTNTLDIQSLFRKPTKAAKILSRLNEEREKFIEQSIKVDETCKTSTKNVDKSDSTHLSLSSGQLELFSQAFGCSGSVNTISCAQRKCFHRKYRSFDGKCNNLKNPNAGSALSPFHRLLKPEYENKFFTPIGWNADKVYFGFPKPSARVVSQRLLRANRVRFISVLI